MAVGANDQIDKMLVQKYQAEQVDNHDNADAIVKPEEMMSAMNDYASTMRSMVDLQQRLSVACYAINARSARYKRSLGRR